MKKKKKNKKKQTEKKNNKTKKKKTRENKKKRNYSNSNNNDDNNDNIEVLLQLCISVSISCCFLLLYTSKRFNTLEPYNLFKLALDSSPPPLPPTHPTPPPPLTHSPWLIPFSPSAQMVISFSAY